MAFIIEQPISAEFSNFDDLLDFVAEEEKRLFRLPLSQFMKKGARFSDNLGIGANGTYYRFNEASFKSLSNIVGVKPGFLRNLQKEDLASQALNDTFLSGKIGRNINSLEIVCDASNNQVLGFVSDSYVGYSNKRFVDEVLLAIDPEKNTGALFPDLGDFEFQQGYSVNSRIHLRITSKKVTGTIQGHGGAGDDISKIGLELTNSMAGGHALRLSYFILRLICANGLTVPVTRGNGKIIHSGTEESFQRRLNSGVGSALRSLKQATRMLSALADIPFEPRFLAGSKIFDEIFSVIPGLDLKSNCRKTVTHNNYTDIPNKKDRDRQRKADMLAAIPSFIGRPHSLSVFDSSWRNNANLWDFINLFTEYAKEMDIQKRIEAERRAGEIADWISKNKRKFSPQAVTVL